MQDVLLLSLRYQLCSRLFLSGSSGPHNMNHHQLSISACLCPYHGLLSARTRHVTTSCTAAETVSATQNTHMDTARLTFHSPLNKGAWWALQGLLLITTNMLRGCSAAQLSWCDSYLRLCCSAGKGPAEST